MGTPATEIQDRNQPTSERTRSRVAAVFTKPDTVLDDYRRLLDLVGVTDTLR
ncbi:MAG: hypothetical protein GF341_03115, partial [candidate division Zixibacteria bacterium]|nr:hypothetical protein [candidate division Zixibacteria bacterium]